MGHRHHSHTTRARRRGVATAALLLVGALALSMTGAEAQILPPIGSTTTTTGDPEPPSSSSSTAPPTTTTTRGGGGGGGIYNPMTTTTEPGRRSSTTTTEPEGGGRDGGRKGSRRPPSRLPKPGAGDGAPPVKEAIERGVVPKWAIKRINAVPRTGGNNTEKVLEALEPLRAVGFTRGEIAMVGLGRFPIRGRASFADDWWYPRFVPEFHLHEGTDIFAAFGTPVVAPVKGVLTIGRGPVSGFYSYLTTADGTYYFFGHLQRMPRIDRSDRIKDPAVVARYARRPFDRPVAYRVEAGDRIGEVGDTGNAKGGPPHVHMEHHPQGGGPVNPKPTLDRWLADALAKAPEVVALYTSGGPKAVLATQRTRSAGDGQFAAPTSTMTEEVLGVASAGPGTGVRVVNEHVARVVGGIDWSRYRGATLATPAQESAALLRSVFAVGRERTPPPPVREIFAGVPVRY